MLSLADYQELTDRAPVMLWRADAQGRCDWLSARALAFTGAPGPSEDAWAAGIHPDDLDRCLAAFRAHLAARTPFELAYRLRRADGAYRVVADHAALRFDAAGRFAGFVGTRVERGSAPLAPTPLPICACCSRVRDPSGSWDEVARHLEARGLVSFTHTYCPACERARE